MAQVDTVWAYLAKIKFIKLAGICLPTYSGTCAIHVMGGSGKLNVRNVDRILEIVISPPQMYFNLVKKKKKVK